MIKKSFSKIYESSIRFVEDHFFKKYEYLSSEQTEFEGKILNSSVYKLDDPATRYSGLKCSDFALENQIAVGVEMKPVKCSLPSSYIDSCISDSLK